ncbi:aquaporin PIP2-7-like [Primulina huaijiensis]|uniref:aquaporin PIP2-7-like n=1 Tax=Primulina huaijiensis TaxID=1492673 RepID=UPI003CC75FF8
MVAQCLGAVSGVGLVKAFMKSYYNRLGAVLTLLCTVYNKGTASGCRDHRHLCTCLHSFLRHRSTPKGVHVIPTSLFWLLFSLDLRFSWSIWIPSPSPEPASTPARSLDAAAVVYNNKQIWDDQDDAIQV